MLAFRKPMIPTRAILLAVNFPDTGFTPMVPPQPWSTSDKSPHVKEDFRDHPLEIPEEIIFIRQLLEACGSADLLSLPADFTEYAISRNCLYRCRDVSEPLRSLRCH
jgi:hypothetical protein